MISTDPITDQAEHLSKPALRPYPSQYVSSWAMEDGTQVTIRPICPDDESLMITFHETLSDRTVYLRYFCSLSLATRTAHERLARICFGDYEHEMVLVVDYRDPHTGKQQILAVGRLNKLQPGKEAEVAVLVSDEYQRRGVATELLRRLIQVARDEKTSRILAEMLRDNVGMQTVLKRLGFRMRLLRDPKSIQAVLEL